MFKKKYFYSYYILEKETKKKLVEGCAIIAVPFYLSASSLMGKLHDELIEKTEAKMMFADAMEEIFSTLTDNAETQREENNEEEEKPKKLVLNFVAFNKL